ncbi:hypothetical protein [Microvirga tunisiensis]|uniref:Uncharacterized protein n=1 Tax=Microvirga tunisiensis TaxID=2108360 RepID=A0A5N7MGM9_9HYPH|nr:hypothetical protein [Microvirga tunisiensis]MPR07807.1 hypothetical protein [Microvirga tunisiensis]MPR26202.1 hypothetical protein [Microvirga tunisiensis]
MSKVVTVRTTGYPSTDELKAVIRRVQEWDWRGNVVVPARIEFAATKGNIGHFPIGDVLFDRASADALQATLEKVDAIIYSTPREEVPRVELRKVRVFKK